MKWVKQKHSEESNKSVPTTDGCTINHIINGYLVLGITGITFICQCTMVQQSPNMNTQPRVTDCCSSAHVWGLQGQHMPWMEPLFLLQTEQL